MGESTFKKILGSGLTSDLGLALLSPVLPRCANILMLHRFAMPDLGVAGHQPEMLRRHLEYLRARDYDLLALPDLLDQIEKRVPFSRRTVVFTVDDGYVDFAEVGAPIFAAFDCPVTVFLITDFVSGKLWNWFDKVLWIVSHSPRPGIDIDIAGRTLNLRWRDASDRVVAYEALVEELKLIPDEEKESKLVTIARTLETDLPSTVPSADRAMSWDDVRRCARGGVTYGPHTVTHPILSRVDGARAEREITESWRTVSANTDAAVPVFCYPNGGVRDFSDRERRAVQRAGMRSALTTIEGSVGCRGSVDPFALPRYSYEEERTAFLQIVSGLTAARTSS